MSPSPSVRSLPSSPRVFFGRIALLSSLSFFLAFFGQAAFYAAALAGKFADRLGLKLRLLALPYYFALVNLASLVACARFMNGKVQVTWEPMRGPTAH